MICHPEVELVLAFFFKKYSKAVNEFKDGLI